MGNKEIAILLKKIAVFKELAGENPFKIRAFEQASRIVESHFEDIFETARKGTLTEIRGIGKGVEEVILDYIETGKSTVLEKLSTSFPEGILELLSIPGMGPKKVKAVWEKLGVSTVGELEYACKENRLIALEGFGEKSQEKILKGIEFKKQYRGQYLISEALNISKDVVSVLEVSGLFSNVQVAGSLRRGKTVFKDVDVVLVPVQGADPDRVKDALTRLADGGKESEGVIAQGPTKVSIRRQGLQIDFRIIPEESFPAALQHFTGSKDHNTQLRLRSKRMGLKMNEYGIFRDDNAISVRTEEEVYAAIKLGYIPPEIREAAGEIEAAESGSIPDLVEKDFIHGMIHVHSTHSDGSNSIRTLAEECIKRGYSYLCLSDHSRSAFYANGLSEERLAAQIKEVQTLNDELAPFRIFCGIESDILTDGALDYPDAVLGKLDFLIGSVHSRLSMKPEDATARLLKAISNPYLTILGHISGRLLLSRKGYEYDEEQVLYALLREKVVLEHNCNPHRLDPDWTLMKKAVHMGILISLGPDAHSIDGFDDMEYGLIMARKGWVTKKGLLNCMTSEEINEFFTRRKKEKGL